MSKFKVQRKSKFDKLAKSPETPFPVIPAKAGIQCFFNFLTFESFGIPLAFGL